MTGGPRTGADEARAKSGDTKMVNHRLEWSGEAWRCMFCPSAWPNLATAVKRAAETSCRPRRWRDQDTPTAPAAGTETNRKEQG